MLKYLAIVALWLCSAWIMTSQPNQAANDKGHDAKQGQPALISPNGKDKQPGGQTDKPKSDSNTPKWYAPLERPDWWLVILGFGTLGIFGWQTKILGKSVVATQTAADAAEISAKAAMGVAVPVLMLDEFSFMPSAGQSLKDDLRWPRMRITVKNFGQSPAFLRSFAVEFTCSEHPSALTYPHVLYFDHGTAVEAGKSFPLEGAGVESWEGFQEEDATAIAAGKKTLFIYGCVWYGDVFGPAVHELRFCKWGAEFGKAHGVLWMECDNPYERQDQRPN
jgi:hypothetical protein